MGYERMARVREIGQEGQKTLRNSSAAIVGIGALGTVVAEVLARSGIGRLILIDRDIVEMSNLQRQALFDESDVNKPKAAVAKEKLQKINSEVMINSLEMNLTNKNIENIKSDVVIDCTDNFETRFLINDFALKNNIPFVHGAAAGAFGNVFNIIPGNACFQCIFREAEMNCNADGILNSAAYLVASIQASEAIKILLKKNYEKKLIRINAWNNELEKIAVKKKKNCDACKKIFKYLENAPEKISSLFKIEKCSTISAFKVKPLRQTKLNLNKIRKKFKVIADTPIAIVVDGGKDIGEIIVHDFGELTFKKSNNREKIEKIAREIYKAES